MADFDLRHAQFEPSQGLGCHDVCRRLLDVVTYINTYISCGPHGVRFLKFSPSKVYRSYMYMLPWQQEFKSNEPKDLINSVNPSLYLVMLYMKFDQNWAEFRDVFFFENVVE